MSHHRIRASIGDLHLHLVYRLDPDGIEILERKWHPVGPDILPENLREELLLRTINYLESSGAPVMIPPHNFTLASQLVGLDYQPREITMSLIDDIPLQTIENCRNLLALLQMVDTDCMCERAQTGLTEALASIDYALGHYLKHALQEKHTWLKEAQQ